MIREAHGAGKGGAAHRHAPGGLRGPERPLAASLSTTSATEPRGSLRTLRNFDSRSKRLARGFPPRRRSDADRAPPRAGAVPAERKSGAHWRPLPTLRQLADQPPPLQRERFIGWSIPSSDGWGKYVRRGHTKFTSSGREMTLTPVVSSPSLGCWNITKISTCRKISCPQGQVEA